MRKLECRHADTCLPDYWSGHHRPHVSVPVYRGMTLRAVKQAIRDELRRGAIMGSDDAARLLSADMVWPEEEKQADRITRAAYAAVNRMKPARKGARNMFPDLPAKDNDCEVYVHAYFVFMEC